MYITLEDEMKNDSVKEEVEPTSDGARDALRELDAETHVKVMGLPSESTLVGDGASTETALRLEPINAAWRVKSANDAYWHRWSPDGAERIVIAPRYSADMAAAMKVVETLLRRFGVDMESWETPAFTGWSVKLWANGDIVAEAHEVSLPEAICRAALALVDGPQNQETKRP